MGEVVTRAPKVEAGNRFSVAIRDGEDGKGIGQGNGQGAGQGNGWSVAILDPEGREVAVRACRDETEARTFASTVRQHIAWLSEARFREIYLLPEGA
ncbi:MAG TPA: hypothetical protein VJP03_04360 [Actinomycetota bacterium]|nr:hypothetical protein [Actinomycetota bacterium]